MWLSIKNTDESTDASTPVSSNWDSEMLKMKQILLALLITSSFQVSAKAEDLTLFGLGDITLISSETGESIRGAGRVASRTTGSAGLTATVLDPDSGSIWNFNVTQFNQTSDDKANVYGTQYQSALSSTFSDLMVGFGDVGVTLGDFQFQMTGSAARASARTSAGALASEIFN